MKHLLLILLLSILSPWVNALDSKALLPPDQVFELEVEMRNNNLINLNWVIREGYYLYKDKTTLTSDAPHISIGDYSFPSSQLKQDPTFGEVEIYQQQLSLDVPITAGSNEAFKLNVKYQGCADTGMCYSPIRKQFELTPGTPNKGIIVSNSNQNLVPLAQTKPQTPSTDPDTTDTETENVDTSIQTIIPILPTETTASLANKPLPVDEAFIFMLDAADQNTLNAHWLVLPDHHIYRDKIQFTLTDTDKDATLGKIQYPTGQTIQDEFFGQVETYPGDFNVLIPVNYTGEPPTHLTVTAEYQGCSDAFNICYPKQTQQVTLDLSKAPKAAEPTIKALAALPKGSTNSASDNTPSTRPTSTSENTELINDTDYFTHLLNEGNWWTALLAFAALGIVLAFTPCIFPMIPILSGVIIGYGNDLSSRKAFMLSLAYVLASATAYAVIGMAFGMFGVTLQSSLQTPLAISVMATLFVLLSLSMFGFYELQLPSSLQSRLSEISNRQRSGSFIGAAIMGFLSTLIVGPCTAPVLATALTYIAQTNNALLGAAALFTMGFAMGIPLLIVGTSAGHLLPRTGSWMDTTKAIFGIMMLGMAIWMLDRVVAPEVTMALTSILLIVSGIYMGALDRLQEEAGGWGRFWKSIGLILLFYGTLILFGVAAGSQNLLQPLKGLTNSSEYQNQSSTFSTNQEAPLFTYLNNEAQLTNTTQQAKQQNKFILVDFYADWCIDCKRLDRNVFNHPDIKPLLRQHFITLKVDVTRTPDGNATTTQSAYHQAIQQQFETSGFFPTILFLDSEGLELTEKRLVGYRKPEAFKRHIETLIQNTRNK